MWETGWLECEIRYIYFAKYTSNRAYGFHKRLNEGDWSSGMIPDLGAGGRGFDSPITPSLPIHF